MTIEDLREQLDRCRISDRYRFHKRLGQCAKRSGEAAAQLAEEIRHSCAWVQKRRDLLQDIELRYPDLPVSAHKEKILKALASSQVLILAGETGSGKTTQIPKTCLDMGFGCRGMIGHTQPRRLAARAVASRVAEELNASHLVGVKVRFSDQTQESTFIKVMTDGVLLSEAKRDRFFNQYEVLIIDEAHERSLNIDFLLGLIKLRLIKRPDLKVIITSATIDVQRFSKFFSNAPVIEVGGRTYPVEVKYRSLQELQDHSLPQQVVHAVKDIQSWHRSAPRSRPSDVLVFLPGERDIRESAQALRGELQDRWEILPLYARLTPREQQRIFKVGQRPRVILSTNVAETSLTVPNIGYVVDSGLVRMSRYSARSGLQRLPIEAISKASAQQRAGRCGRVADGICVRLYEADDYAGRADFTDPEIGRANLAQVVLSMLSMGIRDAERFPFVEPPERRLIQNGFKRLQELGAVSSSKTLTSLGKRLARFSVDPTIARMVVAAEQLQCVYSTLIVASALSVMDPRERPADKQQAADQAHRQFRHEESDFLSFLTLWEAIETERQNLTRREWREWLRKRYLNPQKVQEWRDVHRQLVVEAKALGIDTTLTDVNDEAIHKALLSGFFTQVGQRGERHEYQGIRHKSFYLHPSSSQFKRKPGWILCAELVETQKVYARVNAAVEPSWIEQQASHCLKMTWQEPFWSARHGETMATRNSLLFGLRVGCHKRAYREYDTDAARLDFIRFGLVEGRFKRQPSWAFWVHNRQLQSRLHYEEEKLRRKDWVVSDDDLVRFYSNAVPDSIASQNQLDRWLRREATEQQKRAFFMDEAFLRKGDESSVDWQAFPDHMTVSGQTLKLEYKFDPGKDEDGVIYKVPFESLMQINPDCLDWLVPALLRDKCVELIKSLPKTIRRKVVPAPQYADAFLASDPDRSLPLVEALGAYLGREASIEIKQSDWNLERLSPTSNAHIQVLNQQGVLMARGRDIVGLRQRLKSHVEQSAQSVPTQWNLVSGRQKWDFDDLPSLLSLQHGDRQLVVYPRLVDEKTSVRVHCFAEQAEAGLQHSLGVTRLLILNAGEPRRYVEQKLLKPLIKKLIVFAELQSQRTLIDESIHVLVADTVREYGEPVLTAEAFAAVLTEVKASIVPKAGKLGQVLESVALSLADVRNDIAAFECPARTETTNSIRLAIQRLFRNGWLSHAYPTWLERYPFYLRSMQIRMEQYVGNVERDRSHAKIMDDWWKQYHEQFDRYRDQYLNDFALSDLYWILEEYSLSLFSQQLKTKMPVSEKRVLKQWAKVKKL